MIRENRTRKQFSEKNVQIDVPIKGAAEVEAATFAANLVFLPSRAFRLSPGTRHRRFVYPHAPFDGIYHVKSVSPAHDFLYSPQKGDENDE